MNSVQELPEHQASYRAGSPIVVFSHGFGVKRDSRGMFTDIAESLPVEWGYVLFDYNLIEDDRVTLRSYSQQAEKLNEIIDFASSISDEIYLVAHSMGCITASLLGDLRVKKAIFLAPPVHGPRLDGKNTWAERPGAFYDGDNLIVPRKDGTTSIIPKIFFVEANKVDCASEIIHYSKKLDLTVFQALDEDIIQDISGYKKLSESKVKLIQLPGNHNFDPPHREELFNELKRALIPYC